MKNHRHAIPESHKRRVRILLADDNIVNQRVAIAIIEKIGYRADAVANGTEVLAALKGTSYDLVFMDCQMPKMDGYETTCRIRQAQSGVSNPDMPVIAMTAHAMKGDREKCLAVGMNDYIAKPISRSAVAAALNRWLGDMADMPFDKQTHLKTKSNGKTPEVRIASDKSGPVVFDHITFSERLMGDESLAKMVIAAFLEDIPQQIVGLKEFLDRGDAEKTGAQAHKIKGATSNVGGVAMSAVASEMENAGKRGNLDQLAVMIPELEKEFERLQQAMKG